MKANRFPAAMLAGMAAWLPLQSAQACEFTRTPWGVRVSDCKLSEMFGGRYDGQLEIAVNRPIINLPNLYFTDVDARTFGGTEAEIIVDVSNNGTRNAGAFNVIAIGTVHDPLTGKQVPDRRVELGPVSISGLAVGAVVSQYMGLVVLPNRSQDWDVCRLAIADPIPKAGPASGGVFESNESDNLWGAHCTRVPAGK